MNEALLERVGTLLASLQATFYLLNSNGHCVIPRSATTFYLPNPLPCGEAVPFSGYLFWRLSEDERYILATLQTPAAPDMLRLAAHCVSTLCELNGGQNDVQHAYRRLLQGDIEAADIPALCAEYAIPAELRRCVLFIRLQPVRDVHASDLLRETLPAAAGDVLVALDKHNAVLVKDLSENESEDELAEYAQALSESLLGEHGLHAVIGIGEGFSAAAQMADSFRQARAAIDIGTLFGTGGIYTYRTMLLQRLLMEIAPAAAAHYHGLLFNRRTARLFSQEMLDTIDMFLKKDLNLSDTARQLYIHRNTLVYRLDKVMRQVGLDLRHFDDAMTYRLLYDMKKCARREGGNPPAGGEPLPS